MKDAAPAAGRAVFYTLPVVLGMAMPLVTLPVMTRWLTPEDYGTVAVAQVVAALFMGLANLGASTGLERNFFKYEAAPARLARLVHTAHALVLGSAVAWSVVFWLAGGALSGVLYGRADLAGFVLAMCLTSTLGVLAGMQLVCFRNQGRARAYMAYSIASLVLETSLTLGLVVLGGAGVWGIPLGGLVGKAVVVTAAWVRLAHVLRPGLDRRLAGELLEIGLPLTPRAVVGVADNGVDRLCLSWLASLGQAGFYGLANRIGYSVFALMTSLEQLYIPQVYRLMFRGGAAAGVEIGRYVGPYFYASVLVAAAAVLFVEEALWVLVTPAFWPIKYVAAVLATYYGQLFFGKLVGAQWVYLKKTWYATPVSAVRLVLHLGLTLALIGPLGALGAGLALLLAGAIVDGACLVIAQRQYPIRYEWRLVAPVMLLLYASMSWTVLPAFVPVAYPVHLAGRLTLFGGLLASGARWREPLRVGVMALVRHERTALRATIQ